MFWETCMILQAPCFSLADCKALHLLSVLFKRMTPPSRVLSTMLPSAHLKHRALDCMPLRLTVTPTPERRSPYERHAPDCAPLRSPVARKRAGKSAYLAKSPIARTKNVLNLPNRSKKHEEKMEQGASPRDNFDACSAHEITLLFLLFTMVAS